MLAPELRHKLLHLSIEERKTFLRSLSSREAESLYYDWDFWARLEQRIPASLEDLSGLHRLWFIRSGRGWGKTLTGSKAVNHWAEQEPGVRIALVGANPADVRKVMVDGETGIINSAHPARRPVYNPSLLQLTWPNGSMAHIYSGEKPGGLRGPQHGRFWIDEFAKFRFPEETWQQLIAGMRLGRKPRGIITTTPKPIRIIKDLLARDTTFVTSGSTFENTAYAGTYFDELLATYKGTSLEQQELYGAILDEVAGALWSYALLHDLRVRLNPKTLEPQVPEMVRIVMGIDPAVTTTESSDETGAVVVGLGTDGNAYVLEDLSAKGGLDRHAARLVHRGIELGVDLYVGEANNGGDLVEHTLRQVDVGGEKIGARLPFKKVTASRGKRTRAEPVSMIYQQKKCHHVGSFADLESQMCTWDPIDPKSKSPDRVDALVWAMTELMVQTSPVPRARRL